MLGENLCSMNKEDDVLCPLCKTCAQANPTFHISTLALKITYLHYYLFNKYSVVHLVKPDAGLQNRGQAGACSASLINDVKHCRNVNCQTLYYTALTITSSLNVQPAH